ncbi:SHOCT domain-containing protein, partial [Lacticaseibacillus paracasei]
TKNSLNAPASQQQEPTKDTQSFDDQMAKIERLAKMKEEGILTEEEFQQQKKFILNG